MSYKVEIIDKKDPIKQWETNKSSIKDVLQTCFEYQIILKVMLKKYKQMEKLNLDQFTLVWQQKQW